MPTIATRAPSFLSSCTIEPDRAEAVDDREVVGLHLGLAHGVDRRCEHLDERTLLVR